MAPKTLAQKTVNYENDSFEVWLQKTNVLSSEEGDLNRLHPSIYTPNPQNPDAKLIPGKAYVQLSEVGNSGVFLPTTVLGINTEFLSSLKAGDLMGIEFSQLPSNHVWNDKVTYLLKVVSVVSDTEALVETVYSGNQNPTYPINSVGAERAYVKQVNLVDSINQIYNDTNIDTRRILIKAIGMS